MAENDKAQERATNDEAATGTTGAQGERKFLVRVEAIALDKPSAFESAVWYIVQELTFGPFPLDEALNCAKAAETADREDADEIRVGLVPV